MDLVSVGYLPRVDACHSSSALTASVFLVTECESLAMFVQIECLRVGTPQGPLPPRLCVRRTQGRNSQLGRRGPKRVHRLQEVSQGTGKTVWRDPLIH